MNTGGHRGVTRGFTLPEVALAVGIIAFGLVAIFSVLPFGLKAQKDNREETIIRYEVEFWFAALQAGGLPLESMDRVETVELTDNQNAVHRFHRHDLEAPNPNNPQHIKLAQEAQAGWPVDVCGWLSAPDFVWDGAAKIPRVPAKFARVWAVNGSLFDRLHSLRGKGGHFLQGGEFAFSYFLQTNIEPVNDTSTRITLTFHWPISQPIEEALQSGKSMAEIVKNKELRPSNSRAFSILTNLRPRPTLSNVNLDARQIKFMRASLPGDEVTIADLKAKFPDRYSYNPWDGFPRRLTLNALGQVRVQVYDSSGPAWRYREEPQLRLLEPELLEAFHPIHDPGLYLHIQGDYGAYPIKKVWPNGHILTLVGVPPFTATPPNEFRSYKVSFLRQAETWEGVLRDYQGIGLVEKRRGKYMIGAIHNSKVKDLLGTATPGAPFFSVTLGFPDYWPAEGPTKSTECSFWFLK